ncbi:MAG TPA: acyl-ACP--UDP-N-acetylglucosamine O-acyltransferase [Gemmatimonadales bacterium]|nr:acyl-ACP--UDP-N-acetylglucosamine O-acyltransferase [Gemmatimonadales bacterium]
MSDARIHPTAIVAPDAELGADVEIGPFAIVGPQVTLGEGCRIAARATLEQNVKLAAGCRVGSGSIVGGQPQDLKYAGEETWVEVGEGTVIREYCTINRGTTQSRVTRLGKHCLVMTYVHMAHDCHVGDRVILTNGVQLAGHVTVDECAIISGLTPVHQFVKIGAYAFVGGMSRVTKDVPPYCKAVGNPMKLYGLNAVGLQRHGFTPETVAELKKAYRLFFRAGLNISQALERARAELTMLPEVETFVQFIEASARGVLV